MECAVASQIKAKSIIRGRRAGEFILLDVPTFKIPFPINTYVKAKWVIRYIHDGKVIGFKAQGKEVLSNLTLFALEYPGDLEIHSLRKQFRVSMHIPVLVHTNLDRSVSKYYRGMSIDMSSGGISIKSKEELKPVGSYFLTFYLPTGQVFTDMECQVVKTEYNSKDYKIALKFVNLPEKNQRALENCIVRFVEDPDLEESFLPGEKK